MTIELTKEQILQAAEDEYIELKAGEYRLYLELDRDKNPWYFEIVRSQNGKTVCGYAHDVTELEKLRPKRPNNRNYRTDDSLCPNCQTDMIYHFEHCPKCGQKLDWSEE